ncbi:Protein FAM161A [Channa argus]|uniref:Protein FAM161A n=1 Tax=Channa argus TaxID=215402 RepID=A0A6G1QZ63_CHAAH|nr:Protein FAM161A [Channa argus]KAK2921616.1 hypothetical protein Q8A73_001101 [Channa argus]
MYRPPSLEVKELMALYEKERNNYSCRDEDGISEEYDLDSECSEEGRGGRGIHSSLSLEIYGLQREEHVYFSNREYYRRLEELKSAHLRNMAELERMYISQERDRHTEEDDRGLGRRASRETRESVSGAVRKLQRINSQEELDFHETSSGSDQSELCGEGSVGELERDDLRKTIDQNRTFRRDILLSPEEMPNQKQFRFQPKSVFPTLQGRLPRQTGVRVWSNSKVTVPKPFKMMLREEERKKHKVRTRSEIELENMLLRRELEELKECQKQFRASPAPAHIHLPFYEIISRRTSNRSGSGRSSSNSYDSRCNRTPAAASPQPFHFLERERRKREAKIVGELGNFGQREERNGFKARPMPSTVYGNRHRADSKTINRQVSKNTSEREVMESKSDPNSELELQSKSDTPLDSVGPQRCCSSKPVKKQIELSIEMVTERELPYINPLKATERTICSPV